MATPVGSVSLSCKLPTGRIVPAGLPLAPTVVVGSKVDGALNCRAGAGLPPPPPLLGEAPSLAGDGGGAGGVKEEVSRVGAGRSRIGVITGGGAVTFLTSSSVNTGEVKVSVGVLATSSKLSLISLDFSSRYFSRSLISSSSHQPSFTATARRSSGSKVLSM